MQKALNNIPLIMYQKSNQVRFYHHEKMEWREMVCKQCVIDAHNAHKQAPNSCSFIWFCHSFAHCIFLCFMLFSFSDFVMFIIRCWFSWCFWYMIFVHAHCVRTASARRTSKHTYVWSACACYFIESIKIPFQYRVFHARTYEDCVLISECVKHFNHSFIVR